MNAKRVALAYLVELIACCLSMMPASATPLPASKPKWKQEGARYWTYEGQVYALSCYRQTDGLDWKMTKWLRRVDDPIHWIDKGEVNLEHAYYSFEQMKKMVEDIWKREGLR